MPQDAEAVARVAFVLLLSQREGLSLLRLAQAMNTTQAMVETGLERLGRMLAELGLPAEIGRTESTVRLLPNVLGSLAVYRCTAG